MWTTRRVNFNFETDKSESQATLTTILLYREILSSDLDGATFSALQLIIEVVVPSLNKKAPADRIRAVKLALAICEQSLNTNDGMMNLILRKFRAASSQSIGSSGGTVPSQRTTSVVVTGRREAMICFHGLILTDVWGARRVCSSRTWPELVGLDEVLQTGYKRIFGTSRKPPLVKIVLRGWFRTAAKEFCKETKTKVVSQSQEDG